MTRKLILAISGWLLFVGLAFAQVNINTASKDELDGLKGIGPTKAQAIVDYRTKNGPFNSVDDLQKVPGIGPVSPQGYPRQRHRQWCVAARARHCQAVDASRSTCPAAANQYTGNTGNTGNTGEACCSGCPCRRCPGNAGRTGRTGQASTARGDKAGYTTGHPCYSAGQSRRAGQIREARNGQNRVTGQTRQTSGPHQGGIAGRNAGQACSTCPASSQLTTSGCPSA